LYEKGQRHTDREKKLMAKENQMRNPGVGTFTPPRKKIEFFIDDSSMINRDPSEI
jgi:hypothetical protein